MAFQTCYANERPGATRSIMVSATVSRLIFFGGRYLSLLFVASLLGQLAAGFLLAVAVVEFFRIVFDYGLENGVLARFHQRAAEDAKRFAAAKGRFRLLAILIGQLVTSAAIAAFCLKFDMPMTIPLVASLQFACLMGFGYLQAHLQTDYAGGMAALVRPLILAALAQSVLLLLVALGMAPLWIGAIFFEVAALLACGFVVRRFRRETAPLSGMKKGVPSGSGFSGIGAVFRRIAPLGNVSLLSVAYGRVDALVVSWVAGGALLTQYLLFQRLASAPLMFFSTVASVNIARLSGERLGHEKNDRSVSRYRKRAYLAAAASGVGFAGIGLWIAPFFQLKDVNLTLLGLQGVVLTLQVANGFHAALLIAFHESAHLWEVARNNTVLASVLMPLGAWQLGAVGIALAICMVEFFCAAQHARLFELRTC